MQPDVIPADVPLDPPGMVLRDLGRLVSEECSFERKRDFYDPDKKPVPYEARYIYPTPELTAIKATRYVRVGPYVFLDHQLQDRLTPPTLEAMGDDLFFLYNFEGVLKKKKLRAHTALSLLALSYVPLVGEDVLDLGMGDGVLSLFAKQKGARAVTGVEHELRRIWSLPNHLRANNMDQDSVFTIHGNLTSEGLKDEIPKDATVVVANIGQRQYDGDPNKAAIRLLEHLPHVRYFVGGGYLNRKPYTLDELKERIGDLRSTPIITDDFTPETDLELLEEYGFSNPRLFSEETIHDSVSRIAFIVER